MQRSTVFAVILALTAGTASGAALAQSINSTSQGSADPIPGTTPADVGPVRQQPRPRANNSMSPAADTGTTAYQVLAVNDLGMHCGDLDTRVASILPPFQLLLAQVIKKGREPDLLGPGQVDVFYSAASNPKDPILTTSDPDPFPGRLPSGHVYKTNFWDVVAAYDPFYPPGVLCSGALPCSPDLGLPVPNVEHLYIGPDRLVKSGDEALTAVQHAMPGIARPYLGNDPQRCEEFYDDKPFFVSFPFGYVANDAEWFEGAGIPSAAFDDLGRENPYPLVRVQARSNTNSVLATIDTVLPISGEASCKNCHASTADVPVSADAPNAGIATGALKAAQLPVASQVDDPAPPGSLPVSVSIEYAADVNVLRLHDLKHGAKYVDSEGASAACAIGAGSPDGNDNCLVNKALAQGKPVVCQVCHYTPALDLAQLGPLGGDPGVVDPLANGRAQRAHQSNSAVMHYHHGRLRKPDGTRLFPNMPAPAQDASGKVTNQAKRLAVLDQTCYQCHPGKDTRCLRGAMLNGGMLCNDCHGNMQQVGNDFSRGVSPARPSAFKLGLGSFYDPASTQPRVPWANEPGCGSCHTGDATASLAGTSGTITNKKDVYGNTDNVRLLRAYRSGDARATPIVPANRRFAEPVVPASFNGFKNPGAGNPKLYRVSAGHGGVMCEGCHGATHAEWPNGNPLANDNVTATQLQGHTGTLIECSACHGAADLGNTLKGPHGMHPVGNTRFSDGGHEDLAEDNLKACATCHGTRGQGTVLSRAAVSRTLATEEGTVKVAKGQPVACGLCHENPFTHD
jgi:hypothetical protein